MNDEQQNKAWNETVQRLQGEIEGLKSELSASTRIRVALQNQNDQLKAGIIEAKAEIERLEKENAMLKSALERIIATPDGDFGYNDEATRIAQKALKQ